jgi:sugar lactone lactonase YvrE
VNQPKALKRIHHSQFDHLKPNANMTTPSQLIRPNWQRLTSKPDGLGESPFWHPEENCLYWVDIPGQRLRRMAMSADLACEQKVENWSLGEEPGCFAPATQGGWVIATRSGVYRAHTWGGPKRLLAAAPYDTAKLRFNDGKCDPAGRFWMGSMFEPRNQDAAVLYALQVDGRLEAKADRATVANGLAWSPDGRTLYWSDTGAHCIRAWDYDLHTQTMSRERVFAQFPLKPKDWAYGSANAQTYLGRPDGAAVDTEGFYYSAMYEGHRLAKFAPDGRCVAFIETPVQCPTMPCFGGEDLRTLIITTSAHGRSLDELQALPDSGCVFATRVDTPGLPVSFFNN